MSLGGRITGLEVRIRNAFSARSYPGDENLVITEALVDGDARDLLDAVKGRSWQEAAPYILTKDLGYSIPFFTPTGYRYYLPAYLIYLLHWNGDDVLGDEILAGLAPSLVLDAWFHEKFDELTQKERQTIADVLNFVLEVNGYLEADELTQYWKQFESSAN